MDLAESTPEEITPVSAAAVAAPAVEVAKVRFVLECLATVADKSLTRGKLNEKLDTKRAQAVGLSPTAAVPVIEECIRMGHLRAVTGPRSVRYTLTENGQEYLTRTQPRADQVSDEVRRNRVSYLLLKVLEAPKETLRDADAAGCLNTYAREGLELNATSTRKLWGELATEGMLSKTAEGSAFRYTLTEAGRLRLGNAEFPATRKFDMHGKTLNALLEAAREVGKQFAPAVPAAAQAPLSATPESVEETVLSAFEELRRERYSVSGLVPIWEVRAEVRQKHGSAAGEPDRFDEVVLGLWRAKKLRITPITDRSKATPQQLQDGIPGADEILFYLEVAHEYATV